MTAHTHPSLLALHDAHSEGVEAENRHLRVVQLEEFACHYALGDPACHGDRALPVFWDVRLHRGGQVTALVAQGQQNEVGHTLSRRSDKAASESLP